MSNTAPMPISTTRRPLPAGVMALLIACVAGLAIQIWRYDFLCDDAFISFRYARNLAHGDGLVFNPGQERVEGYSNFLWVLILAAVQAIGIAPHQSANPLLIACGLATFVMVIRYCRAQLAENQSPCWLVIPAALLAVNRSFAMWCTSGLETKLYGLFILGAVLATIREMEAMSTGAVNVFPVSALWFAGAALTRPDGVLYAGCVVLTRIAWQLIAKTIRWRPLLVGAVLFLIPVGGQVLFRRAYYDDWFPNTYYAKVGGQMWWEMGGRYLAAFALEYALPLWIPLIAAACVHLAHKGRSHVLVIIMAAIVPHAVYVAAIGGDHFEWRVLDAYIPLLAILFFHGARAATMLGGVFGGAVTAAYMVVAIAAGTFLPEMSRAQYPAQYRVGFPGLTPRDGYLTEFIDSFQSPWVFKTPLLRQYVVAYNDMMYALTRQFVALRQEEHKGFLNTAQQQGRWIRQCSDRGLLPADLHLAIDCVGAIPYFTNLLVLDRVGLTDRAVARQENATGSFRIMAHDKMAGDEYIKCRGVDVSALDNVHLILPAGNPRLLLYAHRAQIESKGQVFADLGDDLYMLCAAPQGVDALQKRMPKLHLEPASKLVERFWGVQGERFQPVQTEKQFGPPYDMTYWDQGLDLYLHGYLEATLIHWKCALLTNPNNTMAAGNIPQLEQWIASERAAGRPVNRPPPPGWVTGPGEKPAAKGDSMSPSGATERRN